MSQNMIEQLEMILAAGERADKQFLESLTKAERNEKGSYEHWSAKDLFAHANYWQRLETDKTIEWVQTGDTLQTPHYEQANRDVFNEFKDSSWEELIHYSQMTMIRMRDLLDKVSEKQLLGPSWESEDLKMWESLVQRLYSHKLFHYAEMFQDKGRNDINSQLWSEWAELVSPLDEGESWQGRVHYNAACGLALAGDQDAALTELAKSLELSPGMKSWARLDSDLVVLHGSEEFKRLITTDYWWQALEANPFAEALADQFIRTLTGFREAVKNCPPEEWQQGETSYQRPVGLALHIVQAIAMFSALKPGDALDDRLERFNWQSRETSDFPDQAAFLDMLDRVEEKLAGFIAEADLNSPEDQFPWTGSVKMSRVIYSLRHTQHHLADLAMELQRRGIRPPDWI